MMILGLVLVIAVNAGAAWVLSTASRAYGQRELAFWNAITALVLARLATRGLGAVLPKDDALRNFATSASLYGAILVGVLWLWCGLSLFRALGIGIGLTVALLISWIVIVATLM